MLAAPGALFFPIDGPTRPLTRIDVTDFVTRQLGSPAAFDADPGIALDKVEKALFTEYNTH